MKRPEIKLSLEREQITRFFGGGRIRNIKRDGQVRLEKPGFVTAQFLCEIVGRVNRAPVQFANYEAPAETLLLTGFSCVGETDGSRIIAELVLNFQQILTRGLCADGGLDYAGWNRVYNPESDRWLRCAEWPGHVPTNLIYDHAERLGGFQVIWGEAVCWPATPLTTQGGLFGQAVDMRPYEIVTVRSLAASESNPPCPSCGAPHGHYSACATLAVMETATGTYDVDQGGKDRPFVATRRAEPESEPESQESWRDRPPLL